MYKKQQNVGKFEKYVNFVLMNAQKTHKRAINNSVLTLVALLFVSVAVFAVDGIVSKSKSSKAAYSNMKKNLSLSLGSGFSYRDNRSFGFKRMGKDNSFNSIITYQKGNITYILPYKNKSVLNKFKTPQKPQQ
jgi:hypothetical protein